MIRFIIYIIGSMASLAAIAGYADFDLTTGAFDLHEFNAYEAAAAVAGFVSSALAAVAWVKGWARK